MSNVKVKSAPMSNADRQREWRRRKAAEAAANGTTVRGTTPKRAKGSGGSNSAPCPACTGTGDLHDCESFPLPRWADEYLKRFDGFIGRHRYVPESLSRSMERDPHRVTVTGYGMVVRVPDGTGGAEDAIVRVAAADLADEVRFRAQGFKPAPDALLPAREGNRNRRKPVSREVTLKRLPGFFTPKRLPSIRYAPVEVSRQYPSRCPSIGLAFGRDTDGNLIAATL